MALACVVDTSVVLRLADEGVFRVVPQLFNPAILTREVLGEMVNHRELKNEIAGYVSAGTAIIMARADMGGFEAASYDAVIRSLTPYLSPRPGLRSNIGEMSVVATAIARSVPVVLMDDAEAEAVILRIPGVGDQLQVFRSAALIGVAAAYALVSPKTARALAKAWAGCAPTHKPSESSETLLEILDRASRG